jgi:hypothetical protein
MNQDDFHRLQQLLRDTGFAVVDAACSGASFGSWHVTVSTTPRRRVVWDGRDGWLILQDETERPVRNNLIWHDVWIAKGLAEQTCEAALDALRRHTGAA